MRKISWGWPINSPNKKFEAITRIMFKISLYISLVILLSLMNKDEKELNLAKHVRRLVETLSGYGMQIDKKESDIGSLTKATQVFMDVICANRDAFLLLKHNGYIDIGVCWSCGMEPIMNPAESGVVGGAKDIKIWICESCADNEKHILQQHESPWWKDFNQEQKLAIIYFLLNLAVCDSENTKPTPTELWCLNYFLDGFNITMESALSRFSHTNDWINVLSSMNSYERSVLLNATEMLTGANGGPNIKEIEYANKVFGEIGIEDWQRELLRLKLIANHFLKQV